MVHEDPFAPRTRHPGLVIAAEPDRPGVRTLPLVSPALTRHIFAAVRAGSESRPSVKTALDYMQKAASSRANPTGSS